MIEGRPRESLVLYEQPTEVSLEKLSLAIAFKNCKNSTKRSSSVMQTIYMLERRDSKTCVLLIIGCSRYRLEQADEPTSEVFRQ